MPIPGLARKPTYELEVFMCTGERWLHGKDVRAEHVREVLTEWLVVHRGPDLVIRIDGEDFTAAVWAAIGREIARRSGRPLPPEPDDVRGPGHLDVASAWRFLLTDDNVLHRLPLAAEVRGEGVLSGGKGPGDLWWHSIEDHGMPGVRAAHRGGTFKILRVSAEQHALVYERKAGDWEAIATGSPEALKERAAASVRRPARIPDYGGLKRLIPPDGRKR
jgi:hypothetical protein